MPGHRPGVPADTGRIFQKTPSRPASFQKFIGFLWRALFCSLVQPSPFPPPAISENEHLACRSMRVPYFMAGWMEISISSSDCSNADVRVPPDQSLHCAIESNSSSLGTSLLPRRPSMSRIVRCETYLKRVKESTALTAIRTVFVLAIRILRFEIFANGWRFESLQTANCDSRHLSRRRAENGFRASLSSGERAQRISLSLFCACQSELAEFLAELSAELSSLFRMCRSGPGRQSERRCWYGSLVSRGRCGPGLQ